MAERDLVWDQGGEIPEEPLPDDDGNIDVCILPFIFK